MNVFISQPMAGKTPEQIKQARENAISHVTRVFGENEEINVLNTYFTDFNGKALSFLGKSIMVLADADIAVFSPGWENHRGCRIEHECCAAYGIAMIEMQGV